MTAAEASDEVGSSGVVVQTTSGREAGRRSVVHIHHILAPSRDVASRIEGRGRGSPL